MVSHPLFELRKRATEPGRDGGRGNPEQACGLLRVEVEYDAERDDLALARGQRLQAFLQLGGEALSERVRVATTLRRLGTLLALPAPRIGAKPVERSRARDSEKPSARRTSAGIEPPPLLERGLERLARQVLCDRPVLRQIEEVAIDVVE